MSCQARGRSRQEVCSSQALPLFFHHVSGSLRQLRALEVLGERLAIAKVGLAKKVGKLVELKKGAAETKKKVKRQKVVN